MRILVSVGLVVSAVCAAGCGRLGFPLTDGLNQESMTDGGVDAGRPQAMDGSADAADTTDSGLRDSGTMDAPSGSCTDGLQNGDETGVDCGGTRCAACGSGCPTDLTGSYFCESLDELPGSWSYNAGATMEGTIVNSGTGSARFEATGSGSTDVGRFTLPDPPTSGSVFLREYVYLETGGSFVNLEIASFGSSNDPGTTRFHRLGIDLRADRYSVSNGMTGELYEGPITTIPRDQWLCFELEVTIDSTAGTVRLRVDGREEVTAVGTNTVPFEGYDFVNVGDVFHEGLTGTVVLYVDDVVASRLPVGC